jgi:hypothetical protein
MGVMVPDTAENTTRCICPACPTFRESKLSGTLFCARGKAKENVNYKDCLCPKCQVWTNYELKDNYYCSVGKAIVL